MEKRLSDIKLGEDCILQSVNLYGSQRRRLRDLGFLTGTKLRCAYIAPSGSPVAIWIRGTLLALRLEDCDRIMVQCHA